MEAGIWYIFYVYHINRKFQFMFEKMATNVDFIDFLYQNIIQVHKFCKNESFSGKGL
jgi:hypothetical protein